MNDPKKPRSAANAMFGLDDISSPPQPEPGQRDSRTTPSGPAPSGASYGFNFGGRPAGQQPTEPERRPASPPPGPTGPEVRLADAPQAGAPNQGTPQYIYVQAPPSAAPPVAAASVAKGLWALVIALLVLSGINLYLVLSARSQFSKVLSQQSDQLNLLGRRADASDVRYAKLSAQFDVTSEKLGMTQAELARAHQLAMTIEARQRQAVSALTNAIGQKASTDQLNSLQASADAKFGTISTGLAGTQKDLDATNQALTGAKTELNGAIAHTHDELVQLAHRTDRDYFEFHLNSRQKRQKIGGVQVQLIRTNTKMNLFTVDLYFDDHRTQRRDESIDEPVFFYMQGAPSALELVVNRVAKNAISGYISAPKGFISGAASVLSARPTA
jgi:hypothetical protein